MRLLCLALLVLMLAGCASPTPTASPVPSSPVRSTVAASPTRTSTPAPTSTAVPTATAAVQPTSTPSPTPAVRPTTTSDSEFLRDVTVPDDTEFAPGERFTKTWRLESTGSAGWESGTILEFVSGDQMGAPDSVPVPPTSVGDSADISVEMQAPGEPGTYKGTWQMKDPHGNLFGSKPFVVIVVPEP